MSNISREQTVVKPDYVGLKSVELVWMSITDIEFNIINHARKKPAKKERVVKIKNAIMTSSLNENKVAGSASFAEPALISLVNNNIKNGTILSKDE